MAYGGWDQSALDRLFAGDPYLKKDNYLEWLFGTSPAAGIAAVSPYLGRYGRILQRNPDIFGGELSRQELANPGQSRAQNVLQFPKLENLMAGLSPFERGERPGVFMPQRRMIFR